jgi:hypothetical protein
VTLSTHPQAVPSVMSRSFISSPPERLHGMQWDCFTLYTVAAKSCPTTRHGGAWERYSSYSFSITALDGGEWSASRPGRALAPRKGPTVPTVQEAGWAPEPVWTQRLEEKSFCLCRRSNLDRPVVQPVARQHSTSSNLKDKAQCLPVFS